MAPRRARKKTDGETDGPEGVQSVPLEPIRVVERELTRPDGTKLRVKVPVYPPFRLPDRSAPQAEARKAEPRKARPSSNKKAS